MNKHITIITVYDSYKYNPNLKISFGFACLIKVDGKKILFDTGSESETLLYNLSKLGIEPEDVEIVVLSHSHWDHTGGLSGFLKANKDKAKVYQPNAFNKPTQILMNVYSTGALGLIIPEQALVIKSKKGLIVITGCAHPGIVNMIKKAKEISNEKVHLVMGGFHLGDATSIIKDFKSIGVEKVVPCHCTGDLAISQFRKEYKENFIENGVGKVIEIPKLCQQIV
jgi:7,8-dihydropterin-6-yl-methyl-4-(beta-D-ribofuranosyl)aminobenzene 5'-phosphate synthase